jgi:hypothetical protein
MAFQVVLFLLVLLHLLGLMCLGHLSLPDHQPSPSQAGRRRTPVQRLLKHRTPLDCPICRLASSGVRPASAEVAPLG